MTIPKPSPWKHDAAPKPHEYARLDLSPKGTVERIRAIADAERRGLLSFAKPAEEDSDCLPLQMNDL